MVDPHKSQMKDLLQPDLIPEQQKHHASPSCSSSPSSSFSSSSAPGAAAAVAGSAGGSDSGSAAGPGPRRADDPGRGAEREDEPSLSLCRISDLKRLCRCRNQNLRQLNHSSNTVMIDVSVFSRGGGLVPHAGRDVWRSDHVKMPNSPSSVMMKGFMKSQGSRWDVISKQLTGLSKKKKASVDDVQDAILKYNPKYRGQWSFDALSSFVKVIPKEENYFSGLFPKIAALALKLPDHVKKALPLLLRGNSSSVTLSQTQVSCLLANAFLCTFPHRNTTNAGAEYGNFPSINFSSLFGGWSDRKKEKLRAIMHYFNVVTDEKTDLRGLLTFERRSLRDVEIPQWRSCKAKINKLHVTSVGSIESEGTGLLQVDFASSWIGGGVLGSGLVQEEILFLLNPELIVSRLFTEKLDNNECLIITGSQQFSRYSGYSDSFEWAGPYDDHLDRDEWSRLQRQIVAIDARKYRDSRDQFTMIHVTRELNKAYCGFKTHGPDEPDIATGKWGCGAFNGDPQLKAVIQLMAAAVTGRGLAFFTFGDEKLKRGLELTHHLLVTVETTVDELYGLLEDFCAVQQASGSNVDLFEFIRNTVGRSRSHL